MRQKKLPITPVPGQPPITNFFQSDLHSSYTQKNNTQVPQSAENPTVDPAERLEVRHLLDLTEFDKMLHQHEINALWGRGNY